MDCQNKLLQRGALIALTPHSCVLILRIRKKPNKPPSAETAQLETVGFQSM